MDPNMAKGYGTEKLVKLKTITDTANLVRGMLPQMQGMQRSNDGLPIAGTIDSVKVDTDMTTKPKRTRATKAVPKPLYGEPPSQAAIDANIKTTSDLAEATKRLQEKFYQENLAQTSVANQIATENAPTTLAIKELQDQVTKLASEGSTAADKRDEKRDKMKSEKERAKLKAQVEARLIQVEMEVSDNQSINDEDREQLQKELMEMRQRVATNADEDYEKDLADLALYEQHSKRKTKSGNQSALMDRIGDMVREIADSKDLTADMRDKLLNKLGEIGVTLEETKDISKTGFDRLEAAVDNVGDKIEDLGLDNVGHEEPVARTAQLLKLGSKFDDIDEVLDDNLDLKKTLGDQLWGAVRMLNSKIASTPEGEQPDFNDLDRRVYADFIKAVNKPSFMNILDKSPSLMEVFGDFVNGDEEGPVPHVKPEEMRAMNDELEIDAQLAKDNLYTSGKTYLDTLKSKYDKATRGTKYVIGDANVKILKSGHDRELEYTLGNKTGKVPLTPGLAVLLSKREFEPKLVGKEVTNEDLAEYVKLITACVGANGAREKMPKYVMVQKYLEDNESSSAPEGSGVKPKGINFRDKAKRIGGDGIEYAYIVDHEKKKVKVYPKDKIEGSKVATGVKPIKSFDFTPGLNSLLHDKRIRRELTDTDKEAYKQIAEMIPKLLDSVGRQSARYHLVKGTKPRDKAPTGAAGIKKLVHEFEVNVGEWESGNTSDVLKKDMRRQLKLLKSAGKIDDAKMTLFLQALEE